MCTDFIQLNVLVINRYKHLVDYKVLDLCKPTAKDGSGQHIGDIKFLYNLFQAKVRYAMDLLFIF